MTPHEEHAFSSADEAQLEYRSLSAPAVVGFGLGLLSALALVTPFLGMLPWGAAVVSFLAARSILAAPEAKTGLGLAVAGLFLSVAVGTAVTARDLTLDRRNRADSAVVAEEFLRRLSKGDAVGALELTVFYANRLSTEEAARLYYESDESAAETLSEFVANPVVAATLGKAKPGLSKTLAVRRGRYGKLIATRRYEAPPGADSAVVLKVERSAPRYAETTAWRITEFEFAD